MDYVKGDKMKLVKKEFGKERGTQYFDIQHISNWDLDRLHRLLTAEQERSRITQSGYYGSPELLALLNETREGWSSEKI